MRPPPVANHMVVFFALTFFHAIALLVFRLNAVDGEYPFSPASTIVLTEATKLCLATALHQREIAHWEYAYDRPTNLADSFWRYAKRPVVAATAIISAMYTANNLLSYFCVAQMDPGTVAIAKSLVPYVTAVILRAFGRKLESLQWACILLQCSAVSMTQYVPEHSITEHSMRYSYWLYIALVLSILITGSSSVWNERVIKQYDAPLQLVNMIMYAFGVLLGGVVYVAIPRYHEKAFFEGYSFKAAILVLVQAIYGLCVSYAYKYADVLIKNLSSSATLVVLVALSAFLFHTELAFTSIMGCVSIVVTSYIYLGHAPVRSIRVGTALASSDLAANADPETSKHFELENSPQDLLDSGRQASRPQTRSKSRQVCAYVVSGGVCSASFVGLLFMVQTVPVPSPPPQVAPAPQAPVPSPPVQCQQAAVAICITGQLRGSLNTGNLERSVDTWRGAGAGCADFFLSLSFDGAQPTPNHGACPPGHPSDMQAVLQLVRPISWRFYNGTVAIAESNGTSSHDIQAPSSCKKPADWTDGSSVLCGERSEISDCTNPRCTHCQHGFPYYIIPQTRTHACLQDIMDQEVRRASPYQYIVTHRPDFVLHPLPSYYLWSTVFTSEHLYVCNACKELNVHCAVDYFFLMRRQMLPAFLTVLDTYLECQSRAFDVQLGLTNTYTWPWYFASEGIMYAAMAKHRDVVADVGRNGGDCPGGLDRGGCY